MLALTCSSNGSIDRREPQITKVSALGIFTNELLFGHELEGRSFFFLVVAGFLECILLSFLQQVLFLFGRFTILHEPCSASSGLDHGVHKLGILHLLFASLEFNVDDGTGGRINDNLELKSDWFWLARNKRNVRSIAGRPGPWAECGHDLIKDLPTCRKNLHSPCFVEGFDTPNDLPPRS